MNAILKFRHIVNIFESLEGYKWLRKSFFTWLQNSGYFMFMWPSSRGCFHFFAMAAYSTALYAFGAEPEVITSCRC